jgi:peroxiredoxin Q/BCP
MAHHILRGRASAALALLLLAGSAAAQEPRPGTRALEPLPGTVQAVYDEDGLVRVGTPAPRFALPRADGTVVRLAELLGRPIILYFYPMDDTPGCTKEACGFRDDYAAYDSLGVRIVGISTDDPASHRAFAEKHDLPFLLLSDVDGKVCSLYGVAFEKERDGKSRTIARRVTYLLDARGSVLRVYPRVDPAGHSAEILAVLGGLLREAETIRKPRPDGQPRDAGAPSSH